MESMQTAINAKQDDEAEVMSKQVEALDIGISAEAAKAMGVNSMKPILAKHGHIAVNAGSTAYMPTRANSFLDEKLPE